LRPKTPEEIKNIRHSGQILAEVLQEVAAAVKPGITTAELDKIAHAQTLAKGGQPAFLDYQGFPASICISINDEVVHGIPGKQELEEGDIVGLDFGVVYRGMFTDSAITVPVGEISQEAKRLLVATREALQAGIKQAKAGNRVGDISAAIQKRLEQDKLGIIEDLSGHGVGHAIHEEPNVPNFGSAGTGLMLKAGMTLAIEPMATLGGKDVIIMQDGWTFATEDRSLAAQFEHTVLVTNSGAEILTQV
jgi:methionyl aminopeptidase